MAVKTASIGEWRIDVNDLVRGKLIHRVWKGKDLKFQLSSEETVTIDYILSLLLEKGALLVRR